MFDTSHMHVWSDETKSNKLSGTTAEKKNCSSAWTAKTEIEQPFPFLGSIKGTHNNGREEITFLV